MEGSIVDLLEDINPNNRNYEWYTKYISILRMQSRPLFDPIRVRENKKIILSQQSLQNIIDTFKDKDFIKNTNFKPLGIWSRMLNLIVEELTKAPPKCELNATDAQAISDKKSDIILLKTKHILENDLNTNAARIGDPATMVVGNDKFKGNIDEFQRLGLDPNDPDDIAFYEQSGFQRLKYEIAGQSLINNIMKANRFDEATIRKFVIDILAVLGICMQAYVDRITGEIKYRYLFPEEVWGIFGDTEDGSDDICQGYQRSTTVREWLGMVGNKFDWEKDWRKLLSGINYYSGNKYTGFVRYRNNYECFGNEEWSRQGSCIDAPVSNLVDWSQAYLFRVYTGYVEWNVTEATATYLKNRITSDLIPGIIDYDFDMSNVSATNAYEKESFYQEQMYGSYYLATGFSSQFIYNFGTVYYQRLEGAFDEKAKGTMLLYRLEGTSAAEISEPVINICNQSFYRMKWLLSKVKPPDDEYSYDELIQMSKGFKKDFLQNGSNVNTATTQGIIQDLVQYQRENSVKLRFFPQVDGKVIPQIPSFPEKRSGEEILATQMQVTINWGETWIAQKIGLNDIRLGQQENDRQTYRSAAAETQSSLNSTGYIYRMVQYLKQYLATVTCLYAQDIVRFKDSIPYLYLQKLLGEDDFENLKLLGNFAQHRYGIFIDDYNTEIDKQRLMAAADKALDSGDGRGGITIGQWGILMMQEDYKKGLRLLDFYNYKVAKKLRQQQVQDMATQQQNALQLEKAKQQTIQLQGQLAITKEQVAADGYKYAADRQYAAKVDTKQIGIGADTQKIIQKTQAEKEIAENKATIDLQKSLTPTL